MTTSHEKYSNDINLESWTCSMQIYWVFLHIFAEKVMKEHPSQKSLMLIQY